MELSDLYSSKIIEIAGRLPITEKLVSPDATARRVSRICGSVVEVSLKMEKDRVADYSHEVSACALGQTAASIVCERIIGSSPDELRELRDKMTAMLKEEGPPPNGKWLDLEYLQPVRTYPARHTSTLLVFEAVVDCLDKLSEQRGKSEQNSE